MARRGSALPRVLWATANREPRTADREPRTARPRVVRYWLPGCSAMGEPNQIRFPSGSVWEPSRSR